jgi:hypothetical protein
MDTQKLDTDVEKLLPQLNKVLSDALSGDMKKLYVEYTFLTLFDACKPHTELGISEAQKSVSRAKRILEKIQK